MALLKHKSSLESGEMRSSPSPKRLKIMSQMEAKLCRERVESIIKLDEIRIKREVEKKAKQQDETSGKSKENVCEEITKNIENNGASSNEVRTVRYVKVARPTPSPAKLDLSKVIVSTCTTRTEHSYKHVQFEYSKKYEQGRNAITPRYASHYDFEYARRNLSRSQSDFRAPARLPEKFSSTSAPSLYHRSTSIDLHENFEYDQRNFSRTQSVFRAPVRLPEKLSGTSAPSLYHRSTSIDLHENFEYGQRNLSRNQSVFRAPARLPQKCSSSSVPSLYHRSVRTDLNGKFEYGQQNFSRREGVFRTPCLPQNFRSGIAPSRHGKGTSHSSQADERCHYCVKKPNGLLWTKTKPRISYSFKKQCFHSSAREKTRNLNLLGNKIDSVKNEDANSKVQGIKGSNEIQKVGWQSEAQSTPNATNPQSDVPSKLTKEYIQDVLLSMKNAYFSI